MRYAPIVLLFGILLNFGCVLVFRLKLDRKYNEDFVRLSESLQNQLVAFSSDALRQIDDYFASNRLSRASSSSSSSDTSVSSEDILFKDSGEWDYSYMMIGGLPFARVGIVNFSVGSKFPRGGSITAIYPDYVVVNDTLSFRNRSFRSASSVSAPVGEFDKPVVPDTTYKPNKELIDYVKRPHTMR